MSDRRIIDQLEARRARVTDEEILQRVEETAIRLASDPAATDAQVLQAVATQLRVAPARVKAVVLASLNLPATP